VDPYCGIRREAAPGKGEAGEFGRYMFRGDGVSDIHMNQGSTKGFTHHAGNDSNDYNGIWQDGALIGRASRRNNGAAQGCGRIA
jgi:uncharacterized protein YukJ